MMHTVYPVIPPFIHVLLLEYTDCGLLKRFAFPEATPAQTPSQQPACNCEGFNFR